MIICLSFLRSHLSLDQLFLNYSQCGTTPYGYLKRFLFDHGNISGPPILMGDNTLIKVRGKRRVDRDNGFFDDLFNPYSYYESTRQ